MSGRDRLQREVSRIFDGRLARHQPQDVAVELGRRGRTLVLLAGNAEEILAAIVPRQADRPIVIVRRVAPAGRDRLDPRTTAVAVASV